MNIQKLQADLNRSLKMWVRESKSLDTIGASREWVNGVCYGMRVTVKAVKDHIFETRKRRPR